MSATLPDPVATSLGGAYRIERELGGGGMSRVYLATDAALGRRIVVKVLPPELSQGFNAERFAREIKLAAALQDPHIVPVLTAGTTDDGAPYYTMPYVEGESLRARLMRRDPGGGPVPLGESVGILRDVARALEYAHAHGVVHRDIKPENVLLAGRTAVVADFGIAKAMSAARTFAPIAPPSGTLTSIGQSIGTPAYMAPEQVAGEATDHRADLYAWGMLAYELLAGRHPFADKVSAAQLMTAQLAEMPAPLGDRVPGLPLPLGALVMKCLAKDPGARPDSATAVLEALETSVTPVAGVARPPVSMTRRTRLTIAAAAVVMIGTLGATVFARRNTPSAAATPAGSSLAVLPFEHQGDSADAYLTDGITDEIRGKFTGVHDLVVIARASSNQYRATKKTPVEIAKELGVRYLLSGTVRVVGTGDQRRVLVRPELVEITTDGQAQSRWGQPFDATATDVIQVQSDIAGQVVGAMEVALGGDERAHLGVAPTRDAAAYDLYLRGRAAIDGGAKSDAASLRAAIGFYRQALARDSTMVEAQSWLATAYNNLYIVARSRDVAEDARHAAERVIAMDPNGAFGARAMGGYLRIVRADPVKALEYHRRAYRAAPGDAIFAANLASTLLTLGQVDEAIRYYDVAARLDPRSVNVLRNRSIALRKLGRYEASRAAIARAAALAPSEASIAGNRVVLEAYAGDLSAARRALVDATPSVSRDALLAWLAGEGMGWVLDDASARQLMALGPEAFGGDRAAWALGRARQLAWRGDAAARAWGDSASRYLRRQSLELPDEAQVLLDLSEALAYAGQRDEALAIDRDAIVRTRAQAPSPRYQAYGVALYTAAGTALAAGDRTQALAWLDELRPLPSGISAAALRLDPTWKALHGDPRFEQLLARWSP